MTILGPYTKFPALKDLLTLVRQQRKLEAKIAPLEALQADEKRVRAQIDERLLVLGVASNEGVTCAGYDVVHHERQGAARLNQDVLVEQLVAGGVDREFVQRCLEASTERGQPSSYATVKPSKGAKVRAA